MHHTPRRTGLLLILLIALLLPAAARAQDGDSTIYRNIAYIPDGDPLHRLDLYLPASGTPPYPVVVMWAAEYDAKVNLGGFADDITAHGWAMVAADYQLVAEGMKFDALCALAWVHAHAENYDLDVTRIALFGGGWGGNLAALLGTVDDLTPFANDACPNPLPQPPLAVAVAGYGAYPTTTSLFTQSTTSARGTTITGLTVSEFSAAGDELLGIPPLEWRTSDLSPNAQQVAQDHPLYWLDADDPPFLLIYGTSDNAAIHAEQYAFADYLETVGVPVEIVVLERFGHHTGALAGFTGEMEAFFEAQFAAVN